MKTALIISDRAEKASSLRKSLERDGYVVDQCVDAYTARVVMARHRYDMLVDQLGALKFVRLT
jgi:DNA-binding response OmpR family regulator